MLFSFCSVGFPAHFLIFLFVDLTYLISVFRHCLSVEQLALLMLTLLPGLPSAPLYPRVPEGPYGDNNNNFIFLIYNIFLM